MILALMYIIAYIKLLLLHIFLLVITGLLALGGGGIDLILISIIIMMLHIKTCKYCY